MRNPNIDRPIPDLLLHEISAKIEKFDERMQAMGVSLCENPDLHKETLFVFTISDFIRRNCLRNSNFLRNLIDSGDLSRSYANDQYRQTLHGLVAPDTEADEVGKLLRQFRNREMVRIAWRDIVGYADFTETSNDLSNLADACLDTAISFLYQQKIEISGLPVDKRGHKQQLVVLGMGKLGARELNFSSDIDLIFAFSENGNTTGATGGISNTVFFTDLCRKLIRLLGSPTADGFVFRIDMGLRPYGNSGPLVLSFEAMESYYQEQGREWERYALIKARACAGDIDAGGVLLNRLKPFIFRRYLDYGTFDSIREMKLKISTEIARHGMADNIKLGPGGIREIEFFGQVFQLIRGGVEPALQNRAIRTILKTLEQNGTIEPTVWQDLDRAYLFLRSTENKLQEIGDQQTHHLPADVNAKCKLALAMGFTGYEAFNVRLAAERRAVHMHFGNLLQTNTAETAESDTQKNEQELKSVWLETASPEQSLAILTRFGFADPKSAINVLADLKNDFGTRSLSREGRNRLDRLIPIILAALHSSDKHPEAALLRIVDLLKAVQRRTCYLSLLIENKTALVHLIRLIAASPFIASFLSQHPVLLDELLDPRRLYAPPKRKDLVTELNVRMGRVPHDDLEYILEELCIFKQVNLLRVVSADVTGILPLMKVSDRLTYIAETIVAKVFEISFEYLKASHGEPACFLGNEPCGRGLGVVAYGKLGGLELGYGSDLDLVFLHAGIDGETTGGPRPVSNTQFFSRLGQRILHVLTTFTSAGRLYEIDMRLRPSGSAGMLVSHLEAFRQYQMEKAWTWEHQALVRARFICGNRQLQVRFDEIRAEVLAVKRDPQDLCREVIDMRTRLRKEQDKSSTEFFDLKNGPGGIVDIEFLVQYLVLKHAHTCPQLTRWPDNIRILKTLLEEGFMDKTTEALLRKSYLIYRAEAHRLSLLEKPAMVPADDYRSVAGQVTKTWQKYFGG